MRRGAWGGHKGQESLAPSDSTVKIKVPPGSFCLALSIPRKCEGHGLWKHWWDLQLTYYLLIKSESTEQPPSVHLPKEDRLSSCRLVVTRQVAHREVLACGDHDMLRNRLHSGTLLPHPAIWRTFYQRGHAPPPSSFLFQGTQKHPLFEYTQALKEYTQSSCFVPKRRSQTLCLQSFYSYLKLKVSPGRETGRHPFTFFWNPWIEKLKLKSWVLFDYCHQKFSILGAGEIAKQWEALLSKSDYPNSNPITRLDSWGTSVILAFLQQDGKKTECLWSLPAS